MNKSETRKQHLKLTAKLYEIASDFDEATLRELAHSVDMAVNPAVRRVAQGLLQLIREPSRRDNREEFVRREVVSKSTDSLTEFFQSRELFPTAANISTALPFKLPVRQKEARDRYVKRLVGQLNSLPPEDRARAVEAVQKHISSRVGSGFVSNWSKLIRGL